jgi:hypothetical protein
MTKTERRVLASIQQAWPHTIRKTDCAPVTPRAFEDAVMALRREHYPIASGPDGYWWAMTPDELVGTAEGLLRRMARVAETREALMETAQRMRLAAAGHIAPTLFGDVA